jgi:hypothetical protein
LRYKPNLAEAHQIIGHALADSGKWEAALASYQSAIRANRALSDIHNNLGAVLRALNRQEEAEAALREAVRRAPNDPGPLINLSSVLKELCRFQEAGAVLRAALALAPADTVLLYNAALLALLTGQWETAWPGWELRFRAGAVPDRGLTEPRWDGGPLHGKTLLVHAEQGLGDTIQFCRYLMLLPTDAEVVFEVQPRLAALMATLPGHRRIVRVGDPLPKHDIACPLLSLPVLLGSRIRGIAPANAPYLAADPARIEHWRDMKGGFRIGIAWQGNPNRVEDRGRSIPLECFRPLLGIPGVRLISLQTGPGMEQLPMLPEVETLGASFDAGPDAFLDTAAVMMGLDLVITSDTSIAHLAGALGRPVWVALRAAPDWRWMLDRPDSPWYPTMRLFRQTTRNDWSPVFEAMAAELAS